MPHPNASKGRAWELYCSKLLHIQRRPGLGDHDDGGDLEDPDFVYECKDDGSRSPAQWWAQAERARKRMGKPWAIVLSKARLPKPGAPRGWAQMSIEQWGELREYITVLERIAVSSGRIDALRRDMRASDALRVAYNPLPISRRPAP